MAKKPTGGFKSVAATKAAISAKKKGKAKMIAKAHMVSGFDSIQASFVKGGGVRSR